METIQEALDHANVLTWPECAHYVLAGRDHSGSWLQPGSFYEAVHVAIQRADAVNLTLICRSFLRSATLEQLYRWGRHDLVVEVAEAYPRNLSTEQAALIFFDKLDDRQRTSLNVMAKAATS